MSPQKIALLTDSTCDIPQNLIDRYEISMIPHIIIWGNEEYRDRVDLQPEDFYKRLETDSQIPTSAQATAQDFAAAYEKAQQQGAEEIVVFTVSGAMSGAIQSARNAAKMVNIPVHAIDSKGPTMSLGWQVLAAARVREAGGAAQAMIAKADQVRKTLVQFVCMDTIEFLRKGGRIGDAARLISTMLHIKPLVSINHETGRVEAVGIARTHTQLIDMFYRKFFEKLDTRNPFRIAILHGNVREEAEELAERIKREFSPLEILINITGPVLGINTGPRALALCGYTE
jgi:DegV family protein with EDD domain